MRVTLFQPCNPGIAMTKELDLDFVPFPGLVIQGSDPFTYSHKVDKVRYDLPTGRIIAEMSGRVAAEDIPSLREEGWEPI